MFDHFKKLFHNDIFVLMIINIFFFLCSWLIFGINYQGNDDFAISMFTSKSYGSNFSFLGFSNSIYLYIIGIIQSTLPFMNWNVGMQIIFSLVSLIIISNLIAKRFSRKPAAILIIIMLSLITPYIYISFTFTITSALFILAGSLLLLYSLQNCLKISNILFGYFLILFGSLLRFENVYMIMSFVFINVVHDLFIQQKLTFDKIWINKFLKYAGIFCMLFIIIFGFKIFDKILAQKDSQANYYTQYTKARGELLDLGTPDYNANIAAYKNLNISEADLTMFKHWTFADPDKFNLQTLNKIIEMKSISSNWRGFMILFKNLVKSIIMGANWFEFKIILFALVILYFILFRNKQRYYPLSICLNVGLLYTYLCCINRVIRRVEIGIWFAAIIFLLLSFDYYSIGDTYYLKKLKIEARQLNENRYLLNLILIFISVVMTLNFFNIGLEVQPNRDSIYKSFINEINKHTENIYLIDIVGIQHIQESYENALAPLEEGDFSNIYFLGGWQVETPPVNQILKNYDIRNPFIDVINNAHAFIVVNNSIDEKLEYIQRNYNPNVEAVLINEVHTFNIYKIVTIK